MDSYRRAHFIWLRIFLLTQDSRSSFRLWLWYVRYGRCFARFSTTHTHTHTFHIVFGKVFSVLCGNFFISSHLSTFPTSDAGTTHWCLMLRDDSDVQITIQLVPSQGGSNTSGSAGPFLLCPGCDATTSEIVVHYCRDRWCAKDPEGDSRNGTQHPQLVRIQGRHKFQSDTQRTGTGLRLFPSRAHIDLNSFDRFHFSFVHWANLVFFYSLHDDRIYAHILASLLYN